MSSTNEKHWLWDLLAVCFWFLVLGMAVGALIGACAAAMLRALVGEM